MPKLLLEIETIEPEKTRETLNNFFTKSNPKCGVFAYAWMDLEERKEIVRDLPRGKREYYSSNRLSKNKITMDNTKYTNPKLTRFECCICGKIKPVSQLLVDYLGRCISCRCR